MIIITMALFYFALTLAVLSYWNYRRSLRILKKANESWQESIRNEEESLQRFLRACDDIRAAQGFNKEAQKRLDDINAFWKYERAN